MCTIVCFQQEILKLIMYYSWRVIEFDSSTDLNLKELRSLRFKIQVLTIKK